MRLNLIQVPVHFLAQAVLMAASLLAMAAVACGGDEGAAATIGPCCHFCSGGNHGAIHWFPGPACHNDGSVRQRRNPAAATPSNARAHHGP